LLSIILLIGAIVIYQADEAETSIIPERAKRFVGNVENTAETIIEGVAEKIGFASEKTKEKADEASDFAKAKVDDYASKIKQGTGTATDNFKEKQETQKRSLEMQKKKWKTMQRELQKV